MTQPAVPAALDGPGASADTAALARGGRANFIGFLLRLAARLPFLLIAGRVYGAEELGRFAYAVLVVELAAQLATLGMKRGLAQLMSRAERPEREAACVADAMLLCLITSLAFSALLFAFPQLMFPGGAEDRMERGLALIVFAIAATDIALAALAYRFDIASTVRARSIVEPWTISIGAGLFWFVNPDSGLLYAYVAAMLAAMATAFWPLARMFGVPRGWSPRPVSLARLTRDNLPLAAADAAEWGSRRLDLFILGLVASPAVVGVYYVAQQVASLPQKLKTSFDPVLGPVITRNLREGRQSEIAGQVSQVGFWIIAAQAGIGLALAIPGEAVMGLVGPNFVGGTGALALLLVAEVAAATAVVSEAALVYLARYRNLLYSLAMLVVQALLSGLLLWAVIEARLPPLFQAAAVAAALAIALGLASLAKARLLSRILGAPVSSWRWVLVWAAAPAALVGMASTWLPEWAELVFGLPATLFTYGLVVWRRGLTEADRALFRRRADPPPAP